MKRIRKAKPFLKKKKKETKREKRNQSKKSEEKITIIKCIELVAFFKKTYKDFLFVVLSAQFEY